ncbi:MAG: hypothetical protein KKG60_00125 [Nanoarchaeota archaeon]|nr:hypothetical protein [Nanoarchaeota archaeon]
MGLIKYLPIGSLNYYSPRKVLEDVEKDVHGIIIAGKLFGHVFYALLGTGLILSWLGIAVGTKGREISLVQQFSFVKKKVIQSIENMEELEKRKNAVFDSLFVNPGYVDADKNGLVSIEEQAVLLRRMGGLELTSKQGIVFERGNFFSPSFFSSRIDDVVLDKLEKIVGDYRIEQQKIHH